MIQKKICMLGSFAVGKTSLVARFVHSIYRDQYLTTVGVKIDKKQVRVGDDDVTLILWDLHGEDEFQKIRSAYLRGSSGFLFVADGTRRSTFDKIHELQENAVSAVGDVPFVVLVNKSDLKPEWDVDAEALGAATDRGWTILETSARTGEGVEGAFLAIAESMLRR